MIRSGAIDAKRSTSGTCIERKIGITGLYDHVRGATRMLLSTETNGFTVSRTQYFGALIFMLERKGHGSKGSPEMRTMRNVVCSDYI
jgi:hypothetical protein